MPLLVCLFASIAIAGADFIDTPDHPDGFVVPDVIEDVVGDNFTAANAVFTASGGALLHDGSGSFEFPVVEGSLGNNVLYSGPEEGVFSATSAPGPLPNETIFTFEWKQASGAALIPAGALLDGEIVQQISWEMGSINTGSNPLDLDFPFVINHPDADNNGVFEAEFRMFNTAGTELFLGRWFVAPSQDGFFGRVFIVGPSSSDLGEFDIARGVATVSILEVPEPTGMERYLLCLLIPAVLRRKS